MKKIRDNTAITLIALVITIIILLILAGITISLTIGQRGILNRAQEAGKNYEEVAKKEEEELNQFFEEVDNVINGTIGSGEESDWTEPYTITSKDNYEDKLGKKATIPKGFQVSKKQGENEVDKGLVVREAITKNEYVWVPCAENAENGSIKYDRYLFDSQVFAGIDESTNSMKIKENSDTAVYRVEAMPTIQGTKTELDSVKAYGGFYIGRYEVGIVGYDTNVVTSNDGNLENWTGYTNGTPVVQKGKQVWNYITREKAKEIAEGMYDDNDEVISRLCSSYAWDTTLTFIKTNHPNYTTHNTQDNFLGTTFSYTDLEGNTQTKEKDSGILVPTGQVVAVNNIYDMGGNASEWTSEANSNANPFVARGGAFSNAIVDAGCRSGVTRFYVDIGRTFRQTLFLAM